MHGCDYLCLKLICILICAYIYIYISNKYIYTYMYASTHTYLYARSLPTKWISIFCAPFVLCPSTCVSAVVHKARDGTTRHAFA